MKIVYILGIIAGFLGTMGGMWSLNKPKKTTGFILASAACMFIGLIILILSLLLLYVPNFFAE